MSKFLVVERPVVLTPFPKSSEAKQMVSLLVSELEHQLRLQKEGKIVGGGPFLDNRGGCYVLEVDSVEEMGEIFFSSPLNPWIEREVHPLGTVEDSLVGMKEAMSAFSKG